MATHSESPTPSRLAGQRILLGVCAGIAPYKAPVLVRGLRAEGAEVQVVLTDNASRFVTSTSLQAVAGHPVRQSLWDEAAEAAMGHIELARWATMVVVAPATANTIAGLAAGSAHDLLSTLVLATTAPVYLAPAMNQQMYQHAATQSNLARLADLGYRLIGPDSGEQACGEEGPGRMTEPAEIVAHLADAVVDASTPTPLPAAIDLAGVRCLITAGPTLVAIDPVRYISNHSSGKQGLAIAEAARLAGAAVTLVAGPGVAACHADVERVDVVSALDMHDAVQAALDNTDLFVGVAAVADYRPATAAEQKMKRTGKRGATMTIELVENPDIIAAVAAAEPRPYVVGFAAETNDTLKHAREKRIRKGLDAIVVNDVSDASIGFNSDDNAAVLIHDDGEVELPMQSKSALANALLAHICELFHRKGNPRAAQGV